MKLVRTPNVMAVELAVGGRKPKTPPKRSKSKKPAQRAPMREQTRWYVIEFRAAATALNHLTRNNYYPWLPRDPQTGKQIFPGYGLIELSPTDTAAFGVINRTEGVSHLLPAHAETPTPLPIGFVEDLRTFLSTPRATPAIPLEHRYVIGEQVEIHTGPLQGQRASYRGKKNGAVELLLACLGRQSIIYINQQAIRPTSKSPVADLAATPRRADKRRSKSRAPRGRRRKPPA